MDKKRIDNLLFLLSDPDPEITSVIKTELQKLDADALPLLENALFDYPESVDQIQHTIQTIQNREIFKKIENWLKAPSDLLNVLHLICQLDYPQLKIEELRKQTDRLIREIWIEINDHLTSLEKVTIVNHIFFQKYQFKTIPWLSKSSDSYMLNFLLKKKVGSSLLLTILYLYISKKLNLNISAINVPELNLLAFYDDTKVYEKIDPNSSSILFFINPSHEGSVAGRQEIEFLLSEKGYQPKASYFEPISEANYLVELISELKFCYELSSNTNKASLLSKLL